MPPARPSLSRVGLTDVETVVRLGVDGRAPQPFAARLTCFADVGAAGEPTARFDDTIADAVREVVLGDGGMRLERVAERIAERVRERLGARRAEVAIDVRFPERRPAPVSGVLTEEISTLHGRAAASGRGTRRMVGVSATGMTTSPYAQHVLVGRARERLAAGGFSAEQIDRVLEAVPVATHSQLSIGTLDLGCPEGSALAFDAADLLAVVEAAMASEIFELMKRSDEAAVVERAHRRPRRVEDCVAAMIAGAVKRFPDAPGDVLVAAAQRDIETIHGHDVVAERAGLLGDLRHELATGRAVAAPASMRAWLDAC